MCLNTEFTPNGHFDREGDDDKPFGFWGTLFSNKPVWVWGVSILRPFFGRGQGIKCINLDPQKGCYFDNPKLKLSLLMDAGGMIKMIDWTIDWVISLVWPMNGAWYYRYFGAIFYCYDNILAELKFWGRSTHCSSGVGSRHSWMMLFLGRVIVW